MELFVKWDPSDSQDNGKNGKTSNTLIDCYKLDGTRLWSINLGPTSVLEPTTHSISSTTSMVTAVLR